ncbi:inositol polyphosphate-4-phosphatase type I A isoform X2 [Daktulosphaira vitifoliae]|uniref:inositol polyphosphate-4-phosphatase type I A isoform X2 n=1 Tax=Daktulosphaira vitifoliae TaxID=58002 RepID=UPI0021AA74CB|nr:inositol polyphosphate-4-phosphatase type I A isoform X2 [Daktulosphaira vitifoliae]
MRFNKQEMITLAQQPSNKFDKEGLLLIRERQEGFFRKTETNFERWCRLRGNLLFYLKSNDQLSDLLGIIILQNYTVKLDESPLEGSFNFHIVFENGICQQIGARTELERDSWFEALKQANYDTMRARLLNLRKQLEEKRKPELDIDMWRLRKNQPKLDLARAPLCEICFSCDNLVCDGHGRSPNPVIVVSLFIPCEKIWINYANTEVVIDSSNPTFLRSIWLQHNDGLTEDSIIRITVYDVRELISGTAIKMGHCETVLCSLLETTHSRCNSQRVRLPLTYLNVQSDFDRIIGFVTLTICRPDKQIGHNMSTESTPCKSLVHNNSNKSINNHRRTQSLPPRLGLKFRIPLQNYLYMLFDNISFVTYRFHSGLRGDISLYEIMAESKLCFYLPKQLLNIWILEEKELLQEVSGMGELTEPWHSKQVELLDRHLQLLHSYSQAKQNLENTKGIFFKPSSRKNDRTLEFVPTNLHLQRIWVQNDTLKKSGFYDIITVGAFTAHSHKSKTGGLIKLLQQLKEVPLKSNDQSIVSSKICMAFDAIQAIKLLRREVVDAMKTLLNLAKEKQTDGMMPICNDMISKTRILLSLWDPKLVEEAFNFIEEHKVTPVLTENCFYSKNNTDYQISPFKRIASQINFDLQSPDTEELCTPESPKMFMNHSTGNLKEKQDVDNIQDEQQFVLFPECDIEIDENHIKKIDPSDTKENSIISENGMKNGQFLDTYAMCNSPSANYYKPTEEPEPWELTQLNIEASIMCLVSKVKFLCGRCNSPAVRLRSQRSQSFKSDISITNQKLSSVNQPTSLDSGFNNLVTSKLNTEAQGPKNFSSSSRNKFTEGLDFNLMTDWAIELKPSMKKLRQAMDGLLKTARLTHSVFRVQEDKRSAERSCNVRYRRHVCFSQALTALVSGLMAKLWCQKPDPEFLFLLSSIGCLASFECLLSYYGNEIDMWGDMAVAVEDLATVNFSLMPLSQAVKDNPKKEIMPRIIGSKNSLCVLIPVPDLVQSLISLKTPFRVTPIFFNIGINEMATLAENLGNTKPQDSSNIDNFERLSEFCSKYRKLNISNDINCNRQEISLTKLMDNLKESLYKNKSKNVEVLQLVSRVCRKLKGLRFTSCKSAKDRTGMSVTLEQCSILNLEYGLAENEFQRALDCIRSEGCRRENTFKNTGIRKYAFNRLQHFTLPEQYRPPAGTYGSSQT